jgi:hypothetical protein
VGRIVPSFRPQVGALEARTLLSGDLELCLLPVMTGRDAPPAEVLPLGTAIGGPAAALPPAASSLAIPALSSLPGAAASLYLDFDGHFDAVWGAYENITTPAFDLDGNPAAFSAVELAAIRAIWEQVAEDYAPFRLNVTTVEPPSFGDGQALRAVIGGDGEWIGKGGGVAYIDSFTNEITNSVYIFSSNLGGNPTRYTAEVISHEAGHGFGLEHQSSYDAAGNKLEEYYQGPGDGRAPIMGVSYYAARGLWWDGTTAVGPTARQDDVAVIARPENGFGLRPDDHGDTAATATPLNVGGSVLSGAGLIGTLADRDAFSFSTAAGPLTVSVDVPAGINNLDARLELWDATGTTRIAAADPGDSFGATITATVPAGSYRAVVASHGGYGDLGQYTVTVVTQGGANRPPELAPLPGLTVPATRDVVAVPLSAVDPDGDPVTYSATAVSLAYVLDQQLGLRFAGTYFANWGGRGEKWMQGGSGAWHFILPDGSLYRWDGGAGANGTLVGTPGSSYHADPALLHDAVPDPRATLGVAGASLTIDRQDGFVGAVVVTVTAADGRGATDTESFTLTVTA